MTIPVDWDLKNKANQTRRNKTPSTRCVKEHQTVESIFFA